MKNSRTWLRPFPRCILILALALNGCAAKVNVTSLPPGVTQAEVNNWINACGFLDKLISGTDAAEKSVVAANRAGIFKDSAAYGTTITALGRAFQMENADARFLKQTPNNFGQPVAAKIAVDATTIANLLTQASTQQALGVTDATTQSQISKAISDAASTVTKIQLLAASVKQ